MDRNTDYMEIYRNILESTKKRFLRKPNVVEGCERFKFLASTFSQQDCPAYEAYCLLAQARCEHALSNAAAEIQCLVDAGRSFVKSEKTTSDLLCPSYEESLAAAINCYRHAIKLSIENHEPVLGACYSKELGTVLLEFKKYGEARLNFQRAAELQLQHPLECLNCMCKVAYCKVKEGDYEGALTIYTEMEYLAQERGGSESGEPLTVYLDVIIYCEVTRVLLLMYLQPTPQRIRPEHAQTLEKYAWNFNNDDEKGIISKMDPDTFLHLQSLVMACQSKDRESIKQLQSDLWSKLDKDQCELLILIEKTCCGS